MKRPIPLAVVGCVIAIGLWLGQNPAHAQFTYNPYLAYVRAQQARQTWQSNQMWNVQLSQAYNQALYGPAAGYFPANYSNYYAPSYYTPNYYATPAYNVATPYSNPYAVANPYAPTQPGYGVSNPYAPTPGDPYSNPYNPYNPYAYNNGVGAAYMGAADVIRSYGTLVNDFEKARLGRELALQARLDTKKKDFELQMFIKANTLTPSQEQERIAKSTLRRIQKNSSPGEVANGKALNLLIKDLGTFPGKKISAEPVSLSEGILTHLNVTKNTYGLGILRDNNRIVWPLALQEPSSVKLRKDLEDQVQTLVKDATKGRLDANALRDVRNEMAKLRDDIQKKNNEISTRQYMDAQRFFQEFSDACTALEKGEAPVQAAFQRFIEGGKTIQEVGDYMVKEGLRFGPSTASDEAAYRAVYSAMTAYDIAMNAQFGGDGKE